MHGGGPLEEHKHAAFFSAMVMHTLLSRLGDEKSPEIKTKSLECISMMWSTVPTQSLVAYLPGTVTELCKVLLHSHDQRVSGKFIVPCIQLLGTVVVKACNDIDNAEVLSQVDGSQEVSYTGFHVQPTAARRPPPVVPARKEAEALNIVPRDAQWIGTIRTKLTEVIEKLLKVVCHCSGKGMVNTSAHPHLRAFAEMTDKVLASCSRVLAPLLPTLIAVGFLSAASEGHEPLPATQMMAEQYSALESGACLRAYLESLLIGLQRNPENAIMISGWVEHVLKEESLKEFSLISDGYLCSLVRAAVKTAAGANTSDFKAFSKQHGSLFGALDSLVRSVARYIPLDVTVDMLLCDMRDFDRWRLHHATLWVLKGVMHHSKCNVFITRVDALCEVSLKCIEGLTGIYEQWYFEDPKDAGRLRHCVAMNRLVLELIADTTRSLFTYGGGTARQLTVRDVFLKAVFYPVLEKVPSPHSEVSSTAIGVLAVLAEHCCKNTHGTVGGLVMECFDWVVDAVIMRLQFITDYPDTPKVLTSSIELLASLLGPHGADGTLLAMLYHILHNVTPALLRIEERVRYDTGVFIMLANLSALLSRSVRLKQAHLYITGAYPHGAALSAVALAACCVYNAIVPMAEEEYHYEEVEGCSEEGLVCKVERELGLDILEKVRHHVTTGKKLDHGVLCSAIESCMLIACSFDGFSDKLQAGRARAPPVPAVEEGVVVDIVERWKGGEVCAEETDGPAQYEGAPVFRGGISSKVLHHLHLLWSPLIARLYPQGMTCTADLTSRLTPDHVAYYNTTVYRQKKARYFLPTVDISTCTLHVIDVALFMLVYCRDFMEDRIRKELWPLLRYHLTLSPHLFHEFAGAKYVWCSVPWTTFYRQEYLVNTALFRFQRTSLLLMLLMVPGAWRDDLAKAKADPERHTLAFNTGQATVLLKEMQVLTERFTDPRQPKVLRATALQVRSHLQWVVGE
eukprot:TRINITY_DN4380_c0_g1_i5.p1 TRINITY_DN4380_c0_g1~~TRINITY_DN4380_c0_g1_i5.p1  ORF type:complete len:1076 (+),score=350.36 TRINITY_DN4380_c0_g1_i5:331-3228(+)